MGVLAAALLIERETGLETLFHYTCRDRNMLSLQSSLLGAAAAGLRNTLLVTGDPPVIGAYPDSSAVFDIDSIGLTNLVSRLNHGLDPGGSTIGDPTPFVIGVEVTPAAGDQERELSRYAWKVDAGAEFVVTQPVFDPDTLAAFFEAAARAGTPELPVIAGIRPFASLRAAEFFAHEVPDAKVPDRLVERMRSAQEKGADAARAEGLVIAAETFEAIRPMVRGVQLATSGDLASILDLQAALGLA
jgi:homocysteine S-methyltransferase